MSIPTCAVRASVSTSVGGAPMEGARVTAKLSGFEVYQGIVVPVLSTVLTDRNGIAVLNLFPNQLGAVGSHYAITITTTNGKTFRANAVVPNSGSCELSSIISLPEYEGKPDGIGVLEEMANIRSETAGYQGEAAGSATSAARSAESAARSAAAAAAGGTGGTGCTAGPTTFADIQGDYASNANLRNAIQAKASITDLAAVMAAVNQKATQSALDGLNLSLGQINLALIQKATAVDAALTGKPTAPTAAANASGLEIANAAFVKSAVANAIAAIPTPTPSTGGGTGTTAATFGTIGGAPRDNPQLAGMFDAVSSAFTSKQDKLPASDASKVLYGDLVWRAPPAGTSTGTAPTSADALTFTSRTGDYGEPTKVLRLLTKAPSVLEYGAVATDDAYGVPLNSPIRSRYTSLAVAQQAYPFLQVDADLDSQLDWAALQAIAYEAPDGFYAFDAEGLQLNIDRPVFFPGQNVQLLTRACRIYTGLFTKKVILDDAVPAADTSYPAVENQVLGPVEGAVFVFPGESAAPIIRGVTFEGLRFPIAFMQKVSNLRLVDVHAHNCNAMVLAYAGCVNPTFVECGENIGLGTLLIASATAYPDGHPQAGTADFASYGLTAISSDFSPQVYAGFNAWFRDSILRPTAQSITSLGSSAFVDGNGAVITDAALLSATGKKVFIPRRNPQAEPLTWAAMSSGTITTNSLVQVAANAPIAWGTAASLTPAPPAPSPSPSPTPAPSPSQPSAGDFDPASKSASITLSESNALMTSAESDRGVKSVRSNTTGKRYFEVQMGSAGIQGGIGVASAEELVDRWVGQGGESTGLDTDSGDVYRNSGSTGSAGLGAVAANDVIGAAVDFSLSKIWFSKNGVFPSGQNPVTNVGGFEFVAGSPMFVMVSANGGGSFRLRTLAGQITGAAPTGFSVWGAA